MRTTRVYWIKNSVDAYLFVVFASAIRQQHLRRHIQWRTAKRSHHRIVLHQFAEPKIGHLD